jgi:hypothetical protein
VNGEPLKELKHQILQQRIPLLRGARGVFFAHKFKSIKKRSRGKPVVPIIEIYEWRTY